MQVLGGVFHRAQNEDCNDFSVGLTFAHGNCVNIPQSSFFYIFTYSTGLDRFQIAYQYAGNSISLRGKALGQDWTGWKTISLTS